MRQRAIPVALAIAAAALLAACTPGPGASGSGSTGTTAAPTSAPASTAVPTGGGTPLPTTLGPEDLTPDPSISYPGAVPTPGQGNAELSILVKATADATPASFTLVCQGGAPAAESNLPTAAAACTALKKNPALLERAPKSGQACTQQYGGPQTATVTGAVDGKAVESSYSLTDGCEISAWDAVRDILGSAGGAS